MPSQLEYRDNGVIFWNYGVLTAREILASNKAIYAHDFGDSYVYQIAVNNRITEFSASPADMRDLAAMDQSLAGAAPQIGIAVAGSDYLYGMLRMWNQQAETDTFETTVVRSVEEAQAVLLERGVNVGALEYPTIIDDPNHELVFIDHALSD